MNKWAIFGGLAAAAGAGLVGGAEYLFRYTIVRRDNAGTGPEMDVGEDWSRFMGLIQERHEWLMSHELEEVSIRSFDGLRLRGIYFPAADQPSKRLVICFHGYMSCGTNDYSSRAPLYHQMGYDMLIVDARAHGKSEGEFNGFGCLDRYDCQGWIDYVNKRFQGEKEIVLHGISMGAATVLMASNMNLPENVKAIIADCGFTSAWDVFKNVLRRNYHLPAFPLLNIANRMCEQRAGYRFDECSTLDAVSETSIPILFIHGEKDDFVPTDMSRQGYAACASRKKLVVIKGAGHGAAYYYEPETYETAVREFLAED